MTFDAIMSLLLTVNWKSLWAIVTRKPVEDLQPEDDLPDEQQIPHSWWIGGLMVSTTSTCLVLYFYFGIAVWQALLAIPISFLLAYIAVRCAGETDINPVALQRYI
jgi:hypothetical protein